MHIAPMNSSQSIATRLIAALSCIFAAMAADAKEPGEQFQPTITIAVTNLRKGPRTDSEILTLSPKGTTVGVSNCRDGWCRVSWNGQDGYAIGRNLRIAAAPWWRNALFAAGADGHDSSPKTAKTARRREEDEEH